MKETNSKTKKEIMMTWKSLRVTTTARLELLQDNSFGQYILFHFEINPCALMFMQMKNKNIISLININVHKVNNSS